MQDGLSIHSIMMYLQLAWEKQDASQTKQTHASHSSHGMLPAKLRLAPHLAWRAHSCHHFHSRKATPLNFEMEPKTSAVFKPANVLACVLVSQSAGFQIGNGARHS